MADSQKPSENPLGGQSKYNTNRNGMIRRPTYKRSLEVATNGSTIPGPISSLVRAEQRSPATRVEPESDQDIRKKIRGRRLSLGFLDKIFGLGEVLMSTSPDTFFLLKPCTKQRSPPSTRKQARDLEQLEEIPSSSDDDLPSSHGPKAACLPKTVCPPENNICWVCRVGRHPPLRCMQTWSDTGMTTVCPIHPDQTEHTLDECYELLVYVSSHSLRERLFHWMCPDRRGLPPIYTELIDVNELAQLHGASPDVLPWSVGHSVDQWRQNRSILVEHLDYQYSPDLPSCCMEEDRQNVSGFQTVDGHRPKYGNLDSLVAYLKAKGNLRQS